MGSSKSISALKKDDWLPSRQIGVLSSLCEESSLPRSDPTRYTHPTDWKEFSQPFVIPDILNNTMKHYLLWGLLGALTLTPAFISAEEIQYGHLDDVRDDTLSIQYKGPWGEAWFVCDTTTADCDQSEEKPTLFPPLGGLSAYPHNQQGTYGIRQFVVSPTTVYYVLYDISGKTPRRAGFLPTTKPLGKITFTKNGESVIMQSPQGNLQRYDIKTKKLTNELSTQASMPFLSISPQGTYVAMYNYVEEAHKIWHIASGRSITIKSEEPSYVEFSEDEGTIAYLIDRDGFRTLVQGSIENFPTHQGQVSSKAGSTVEDYVFAQNDLFFLANERHPYIWSVIRVTESGREEIDANGSYGDYLQAVDGKLAHLTIDGKNTHVALYDPEQEKRTVLDPVDASPASSQVERSVKKIDNRYGVLYAPEKRSTGNLFIWLHGGPQRQTSLGYHSYLSYAVYDELMERLVEAGNYVYKLDYIGSWGYGENFTKALHKQIGVLDVEDIKNSIAELSDELNTRRTYLIGNSYGGYLALKGIADLPREVDGAISINGVSNWYSLTSRIPSSPFTKLFEGVPDTTNMDAYRRAEVFTGLKEDVKDQPIVVIYGTNDSSVPTWQSTEYIEFAQSLGKNIEPLVLAGEEHVIRRRESLDQICNTVSEHLELRGVTCSH